MDSDDITLLGSTIICLAVVVVGIANCSSLNGGDIGIGYPHEVTGLVTKEPTTRYVKNGEGSGQEKVAISLALDTPPEASTLLGAWANGTLTVECLSTRCTQISKGERHTLACRGEGRALSPNVVVCTHVRQEP